MKKIISLFSSALIGLGLIVFAVIVLLLVQTWAGIEDLPATQTASPVNINDNPQVTATGPFTVYLPLVVNAPTNPKKGLGVIAEPACQDMGTLRASWYLNWWPNPDPTCPDDVRFVPRIANANGMQYLSQAVAYAQASSGWLIGFSEPNLQTQGGMTPAQGAELWKQIEDAVNGTGVKLVSPSPNQFEANPSEGDPYGNQWLWEMVEEYKTDNCRSNRNSCKPHFDAMGWNIYGCTNSPYCKDIDDMQQYLTDRYIEGQNRGYTTQKVWVLEYSGCQTPENPSPASDQAVMQAMTDWFDNTWWIERYAWFSNRVAGSYQGDTECFLIDDDTGKLSTLGTIYQGY